MWDQKQRRTYLVKMGFDINRVTAADDTWVVMMTSHLPA